MAKLKFTKTELKKQQDALKQFRRFLPTLQLKKQQLQFEVRQSQELLEANLAAQRDLAARTAGFIALFGDDSTIRLLEEHVKVRQVIRGTANIAGIAIPTFERIDFEELPWSLYYTDWFVDDAVAALKDAVRLREAGKVLQEQYDLLASELCTTSQRVNLFEKVKIPECRDNIRKIGIALGDANTTAVARCKIAKRKVSAA